jgi:predicted DNA-binding transcriptional regulator YafY
MSGKTEQGVLRIFKLIRLLNSTPRRSARQLRNILGQSESTFYRDLQLIENLGYLYDKDQNDCFFLQLQMERGRKSALEPDELFFLQDHLQQTASTSPLAQAILHKFDLNLSMIPLADALPQLHANRILQLLRFALENKYCVRIKGYHSLSSEKVEDRRVEVLEITQDYRYLIGWDMDKDRQGQYKLSRIQDVEYLEERVTPGRLASPMDIFGLTGYEWLDIKLKLSNTAYHLLLEEFPLSRTFVHRRYNGTFFEGQVRNWKGIGRFILGLPGEIEVVHPEALQVYLRERRGGD